MVDELRKLWKAIPFAPFQIRLKDGRSFTIHSSAEFHHFPGTTEIVVRAAGQPDEHLGVSEVAGIDVIAALAS
jgi:hypothetical protein